MRRLSLSVGALLGLSVASHAMEGPTVFEREIRPVLEKRCFECHGAKKQKANLRLDLKASALKGGDDGVAIVPGKSAESPLLQRVLSKDDDERMPPKGERLSVAEVNAIKTWIDGGAVWPDMQVRDERLDHWAWQPVTRPAVPVISNQSGSDQSAAAAVDGGLITQPLITDHSNPIDSFIAAKLVQVGLAMSPEANRRTLIRRLSFDLLGLPPTPEEIDAFEKDTDSQAYEKLVDRMLASSHYGERWARHWLDIAHYADTHGFERDKRRDNAWHYRDYVIRALNADKPYDQFLREQIAGDVLRPDDSEAVIATGFLAAGPWDFVGQAETKSDVLRRAARADDLDDMVTQVMTAACGVTINCARCHDHKLDPISQREYYSLWAVFAGVKREDRPISTTEERQVAERRAQLEKELREKRAQLAHFRGAGYDLADIVGGGDGLGSGKRGLGIDPLTGRPQDTRRGFLKDAVPNQFSKSSMRFVDGVVVPGGGVDEVQITSTGLKVAGVPKTSGQVWDAIRNGPVNSQFTTKLGDVDYGADGHTLLSLHANSAITFDLAALREAGSPPALRLRAVAGYFGQTPKNGASFRIFLDGVPKLVRDGIGHSDGEQPVDVPIAASVRFLTLMATDNGNGIGHDQICFADARLEPLEVLADSEEAGQITAEKTVLEKQLKALAEPAKVYAIKAEAPPEVKVLRRGNPEQPEELVAPGTIHCVAALPADFSATDEGKRRVALADWITDRANPLTRRVIVNRIWHYHFGTGIVDTPSDFGLGGGKPSHPELLDWLAEEFAARGWSMKAMHRLICTSATYRQASRPQPAAMKLDAGNRLLWRMNPRRLDAESLRDAVLAASGRLNGEMYGPGYRDFDYEEAYAPIYRYRTPDSPDLWRRSIYRFVVRTTPHQFLTTLDCPNPANLVPARNVTTTALQSLALLNNDFMLKQAGYLAERIQAESGGDVSAEVKRAFMVTFGRHPTASESEGAATLIRSQGLPQLCRVLFNANEFIYVD